MGHAADSGGIAVTTWVDEPGGGRARGPRGLARAWVEVLVRPRRFFRHGVAAGDQAPGLSFAMVVVAVEEATRLALVPGAVPALAGGRLPAALLVVGLATVLVAPLGLHLVAGLQTLVLRALVAERAGVGQTVQVVAYATAPCALSGVPWPALRFACAAYGTWLLVVGLAVVHGTSRWRAAAAAVVPAAIVFWYGFRGGLAALDLLAAAGVG